MTFREFADSGIVILDGGMGSMLESRGLLTGNLPERLGITHPDEITAIHKGVPVSSSAMQFHLPRSQYSGTPSNGRRRAAKLRARREATKRIYRLF